MKRTEKEIKKRLKNVDDFLGIQKGDLASFLDFKDVKDSYILGDNLIVFM